MDEAMRADCRATTSKQMDLVKGRGQGGKERQKGKNCLSRFSGTIPNLEKKEIKKKHMTGPIGEDAQPNLLANLCLVWVVYPCRCPTAEWRLRDKRDDAPRQGVPERQRSRARGDKKSTPMPCYRSQPAWRLTAGETGRTGDGPCMPITAAGRGQPLSVRLLSLPPQSSIATRARFFFRAILPNFSCGVIWHTDRGEEKEEGEGGKVVSWELTRCCACHVCCKIRRTGRQTRDAAQSRGDLALALPSADLRHHTVIVTAARPPLCVGVCVCACWWAGRSRG